MAHGFAWLATTVEALRQTLGWADRLAEAGRFGETESALLGVVYGEYLGQIVGGIPMAQTETVRPHDLGLEPEDLAPLAAAPCRRLTRQANGPAPRLALAARRPWGMETGDQIGS